MGNELSAERTAQIHADFNAEMDALKAKYKPEIVAKIKAAKEAKAARAAQEALQPQAQPRLIRSSKGDASRKAFFVHGEDKFDEGETVESFQEGNYALEGWGARKEPRSKAGVAEAGDDDDFACSDNAVASEDTTTKQATKLAERPKKAGDKPPVDKSRSKSDLFQGNAQSMSGRTKSPVPGSSSARSSTAKKRPTPDTSAAEEERPAKVSKPALSDPKSGAQQKAVSGLAALGKIPKKPGTSKKEQNEGNIVNMVATSIDERPPRWYNELVDNKRRKPEEAGAMILIGQLRSYITKCKSLTADARQEFNNIRVSLHKVAFERVTGQLLRNTRMLHNEYGLPQLFDKDYIGGVRWPWDIKADAEELYNKWCRQIFETDLLRGIIRGKPASKKGDDKTVDSIDPDYEGRMPSKYHGNGLLLNGQWWPTQLCTVRDGAHGHTMAGISGTDGQGAFSCIMSGGHDYPDEDHGDWVLYCGTDSTDSSVTEATKRMIECEGRDDRPVRLIRSHNLKSDYAPEIGFRYDGLYKVVSHKNLDGATSLRQRHRFRLERLRGQDPIRGGDGPEKRPTPQEIEAHQKDKHLRGYK